MAPWPRRPQQVERFAPAVSRTLGQSNSLRMGSRLDRSVFVRQPSGQDSARLRMRMPMHHRRAASPMRRRLDLDAAKMHRRRPANLMHRRCAVNPKHRRCVGLLWIHMLLVRCVMGSHMSLMSLVSPTPACSSSTSALPHRPRLGSCDILLSLLGQMLGIPKRRADMRPAPARACRELGRRLAAKACRKVEPAYN